MMKKKTFKHEPAPMYRPWTKKRHGGTQTHAPNNHRGSRVEPSALHEIICTRITKSNWGFIKRHVGSLWIEVAVQRSYYAHQGNIVLLTSRMLRQKVPTLNNLMLSGLCALSSSAKSRAREPGVVVRRGGVVAKVTSADPLLQALVSYSPRRDRAANYQQD